MTDDRGTSIDQFFNNPIASDGSTLTVTLPVCISQVIVFVHEQVNYRPPSSLGRAIPTSANIYNADYFQPRYFDVYNISRSTGTFKYGNCMWYLY